MAHKIWTERSVQGDFVSLSKELNIDPFILKLLYARGIDSPSAVSSFLSDSFETVSPLCFADMEEAAFVVSDAAFCGDRICVFGDYDCDGVTSTALLVSYLKKLGADVFYYIPDRLSEGYGLNIKAIDKIKAQGADLIVTVDNGISSVEEAEYIYSLGMRLVVTDHHQLSDTLPRAEAVVNPHRTDNELEFRDYCGVGVVFKLICAIEEDDIKALYDEYIDLVAIGTFADVVPLIGENRTFVKLGLDKINNNPRKSVSFYTNSVAGDKTITSNDVAFQLCPRINAMGRIGNAADAVEFLLSEDSADAQNKYNLLCEKNTQRQTIEKGILSEIEQQIKQNPRLVFDRVIVISGTNFHQGVIGIVASHIVERYGKPAFIIGVDSDGIARGSARSVKGFNIFEAISYCSDYLIKYGGHPLAAGVTMPEDKVEQFRRDINRFALENYDIMPSVELEIDCEVTPDNLNIELVDKLAALEPYGENNPYPTFAVYGATVTNISPLSEGKHSLIELEKDSKRFKVARFSVSPKELEVAAGDKVNVALRVSKNVKYNNTYLSLQALDICLSGIDDDKYLTEKNAYELFRITGRGDKSLYPDRNAFEAVYKYIKTNGGFSASVDSLYFRLQNKITYAQTVYAVKAFIQSGILSMNRNTLTLNKVSGKANLEETQVLTKLRERLNDD
ncbi:MAG: single-stranded-DNA-specific exonuclease RecJ [Eubacterium sp.]|nr:single-stranded-DNA-specific exonuclease RecJ [Eubacterium sp.]